MILNGEKLEAFLLKSAKKQECLFSPLLFHFILEIVANSGRQEK